MVSELGAISHSLRSHFIKFILKIGQDNLPDFLIRGQPLIIWGGEVGNFLGRYFFSETPWLEFFRDPPTNFCNRFAPCPRWLMVNPLCRMESLGQVAMYSYENKTSLYLNMLDYSVAVYLRYWYNYFVTIIKWIFIRIISCGLLFLSTLDS